MSSKRGVKASTAESSFDFKDIVLGKVKGHPAWPARIVDPASAPDNLRDPKKISRGRHLVKFFQSGDYAWLSDRDITKLQSHEIQAFLDNPHKKGADLKIAYQIAKDPEEWEAEQAKAADEEEAERQEHLKEEKAREEDELEEDGQGQGKKRKRAAEPKPKEPKKRKVDGASKKKARGREEGPISVVREWRHQLQREFLGKTDPTEDGMSEIDETLKEIEEFEMQLEWLQETKLGKVLKRIGQLPDDKVPLDSKYHIRARSKALQSKWAVAFGTPDDKAVPTNEADGAVYDGGVDAAAIPVTQELTKDADGPTEDVKEDGATKVNGNGANHHDNRNGDDGINHDQMEKSKEAGESDDMELDKNDDATPAPQPTNGV